MRRALLFLALGWGVAMVLLVVVITAFDEDFEDALEIVPYGALLLVPIALPLAVVRSRWWYRLVAFVCALLAAGAYVAFALGGAFILLPSALLLLLSVLAPQPR